MDKNGVVRVRDTPRIAGVSTFQNSVDLFTLTFLCVENFVLACVSLAESLLTGAILLQGS